MDFRLIPQHACPVQAIDTNYDIRWMKAQAGQLNVDSSSVGSMGCSSGGSHRGDERDSPRGPSLRVTTASGGRDFETSIRFLLCCCPVPDFHARYELAIEIREDRFTEPTVDYYGDHASLHKVNLQDTLDGGEAVELPPTRIIQGTTDSTTPPLIPHRFEASYQEAGATWSWNRSR